MKEENGNNWVCKREKEQSEITQKTRWANNELKMTGYTSRRIFCPTERQLLVGIVTVEARKRYWHAATEKQPKCLTFQLLQCGYLWLRRKKNTINNFLCINKFMWKKNFNKSCDFLLCFVLLWYMHTYIRECVQC